MDQKWGPYYRIVEQMSPASFVILDQMLRLIKRADANDLKLAEIKDWKQGRKQSLWDQKKWKQIKTEEKEERSQSTTSRI